jgi:hypothetical protein
MKKKKCLSWKGLSPRFKSAMSFSKPMEVEIWDIMSNRPGVVGELQVERLGLAD